MKDIDVIAGYTQASVGVLTVLPEDSQQPGPNTLHLEPFSTAGR